ncbi:MAG: DUF4293 domain-containing protein [Bacteroidaceae bacterium]|nr:DUF4293 domain-containing protein [Bacteroidaceae bacterium]
MIQRIQTIHLLLSVIVGIVAFVLSLNAVPEEIVRASFSGQVEWGRWAYLALIALGVLLAAWSIFLFKTRMRQLRLVNFSIVAYALTYVVVIGCYLLTKSEASWSNIAVNLPIVSIIFNLLACRRIRFDERLVRSADRLR